MTFAEGVGGDRRDQTKGRQHHTLKQLRIFFMLLWGMPQAKEKIFTQLGVPVCYSAQLMMGNPGYIFF